MSFIQIEEGINIKTISTKKFKTIAFAVLIRQKLNRKTATFNAVLSNILLNGSEKYKTVRDINIKIEEMAGSDFYGDIIKKGDNQILEFLIEFPENKVEIDEAMEFLAEIILKPLTENNGFNKEYLKLAKQSVKDTIKSGINNKKDFAKKRCIELMCKNEPFGIFAEGYLEDLESETINANNLFEHYKKIISESEIDFVAIGNITEEDLKSSVKKYFNIENRKFKKAETEFFKKEAQSPNFVEEKFGITQGKLCMGFRTGIKPTDKNFLPLLVANEILGGGSSSKLFKNVREKESLCYYINSFIFMFKGIIFIQSGVDFNKYEKVTQYIEKEIENITNCKVDEVEFQNAINSLEKKYLSIEDYNTSVMDYYYTGALAGINMDINDMVKKIKSVEKDEACNTLKNAWLDTCYFMKGDEN